MFPNVTAKDQSPKTKFKQLKWEDRFASKANIPDYSPLKDKHTATYRKLINTNPSKDKNQPLLTNNKETKTYFQKKVELFEKLKQAHPVYLSHLEEFEDFLTSTKIPNFYIYYSVLPLFHEIDVNGFIIKVRKGIKQQASPYHRIVAAVKAREECLSSLKVIVQSFKADFFQKEKEKNQLREKINHYRSLTANVVDQIKRWKDALNLKEERAIFYSENHENYLIKMLNDNQFIFKSFLSDFINFGDKNDPFVIIPLKKAEGKESNEFLDLIQTEKNLAYYQKYMEYLASQKAYVMTLNPVQTTKKQLKYPEIQKIYKSRSLAKFEGVKKQNEFAESQNQALQRQKQRQERLRKNQEKINAIKSIYESYSSKLKLKQVKKEPKKAETDVEEKTNRQKYSSLSKVKSNIVQDEQFEKMVRIKLERQKNKKLVFQDNLRGSAKSLTKLPKTEDKMIQNLKEIQQTLKSKLTFMNEQTKKQESSIKKFNISSQKFGISSEKLGISSEKFLKKTNQNLIVELKNEIIRNLELENQEREAQRQKRKQEEEKAIEEIKAKVKKEMQEKLEQKKREKLIERQELQKKLKQEEQRLNKQRQLQLQLQVKLAKQKQLRELQKIKRQSLQKQMKFKQELEKEQKLRKQKEEMIEKQRRQKEKILEELKKKQLKEQLQKEIKDELKLRYGQNPKLYDKEDINLVRTQKQQELSKQIEIMKLKQNEEIEQIRKENELRQRMLKLKKQEEELKRKEVQHLMKSVIQQQKEDLHREALRKRLELEEEIKNNAKQKLLEEYKAEREAILEKTKLEKERQLQEQVYREKIKQKIQKELRMEAIQRTKKQMDEREARRYEMNVKLESSKVKFNSIVQKQFDKEKIQAEVKKQLIEKVIFDKQAQREAAKNDLRSQFERELMASALPQIYEAKQNDPILRKNIENFKNDDFLKRKLTQLEGVKPTNQKPSKQSNEQIFNNIVNDSPQKKILRKQSIMNSVTNEQKQMYTKKKAKVDELRSQPSYKLPQKLTSESEEGFELMKLQKSEKDSEFQAKLLRKSSTKNSGKEQKKYTKKNSNKIEQRDSEDEQRFSKKIKNSSKSPKKKKYQSEEEDSEDQIRSSLKKNKISSKKHRQSDQALSSESEKLKQKAKLKLNKMMSMNEGMMRMNEIQQQKQGMKRNFTTLRTQSIRNDESPRKLGELSKKSETPTKIHFDLENKSKLQMIAQEQKSQLRNVKHSAESKYEIRLEAIPEGELDEYLAAHFGQIPELQRQIQLHDRQELYRKLINELTFCMLLGYENNNVIGMTLAFHDRNKTDVRKFTIVHISTYHNDELKDFLVSCVNYIFKKDPTDQIEFHYKFDESIQDQALFSKDFNKWFDKYGNVYQKKVGDSVFERKYAMKRQFNQKCEVVLGGINKNTFRNLFSVYCGVVMSDSDMVQFKTELRDVITPQNQISYAIAIAQLFRTYLTPDEAETLKGKVKEFAKLKELLILVVMLQKKKVKMEELKLTEYKNLIELNMKLMSQGKDVIRYCKDSGMDLNRIYYAELSQAFNLPFNFQTTSLPIESEQTGKVHQISYFRLSPLPPNKLHIIKSSLYNSELHILPTESSKYKLFVINAQQYNEIKETNHLDIFMYVRLFLKNVKSHNTASWKYVWLPEMTDKANFSIREFKSFLNKDIYCHDNINISYKQFLPNALIIQPEHRDLVITPPFIVGIMSMALEQITEGSPLYARMIDVPALRTIQIQE